MLFRWQPGGHCKRQKCTNTWCTPNAQIWRRIGPQMHYSEPRWRWGSGCCWTWKLLRRNQPAPLQRELGWQRALPPAECPASHTLQGWIWEAGRPGCCCPWTRIRWWRPPDAPGASESERARALRSGPWFAGEEVPPGAEAVCLWGWKLKEGHSSSLPS